MTIKSTRLIGSLTALLAASCGGNSDSASSVECGEGTVLVDGRCVPEDTDGGENTGGTGGSSGSSGSGGTTIDAGPDGEAGDTGADTSVDASVDVTDAAEDTSSDSSAEASQDAGPDADPYGPCDTDATCNDGIDCTVDSCSNGTCVHWPGDEASCPVGQVCDVDQGCLFTDACTDTTQCEQLYASDSCKVNIECVQATKTCTWEILDGDGDEHPPIVCGGDDCRDDDEDIHPGLEETCDSDDVNCDGDPLLDAVCPSPLQACVNGACECKPEHVCPGVWECVDLESDLEHCGSCGNACTDEGATCVAGQCTCPLDCSGTCVDPQTDPANCGGCGNDCGRAHGVSCVNGQCNCRPDMVICSGACTDLMYDFYHCGGCDQACTLGQVCKLGQCVPVSGWGVTQMISVPRSDGVGTYEIDRTEVTREQYHDWLDRDPSMENLPAVCDENGIPSLSAYEYCWDDLLTGGDDVPITCVHWCEAWLYCWSIGKRLCGHEDGGPEKAGEESKSQWLNACTSGGLYAYTYGNDYQPDLCNDHDPEDLVCSSFNQCPEEEVGSFPACHSPESEYAEVLDLSGNVFEWVDETHTNPYNVHLARGGSSYTSGACSKKSSANLSARTGFRCCGR